MNEKVLIDTLPKVGTGVELPGELQCLPEIVTLACEDGVVIDGLARREVLLGVVAQTILPELLLLMDGTRTMEQLLREFPEIPGNSVTETVSLLREWGIVRNRLSSNSYPSRESESLSFLRRFFAGSEDAFRAEQACAALDSAKVAILASAGLDGTLGNTIKTCLECSGMGEVTVFPSDSIDPAQLNDYALTVVVGAPCEQLRDARFSNIVWARASIDLDSQVAEFGPVFRANGRGCYRCFAEIHGDCSTQTADKSDPARQNAWASLVALEIVHFLIGSDLAITERAFRRYWTSNWSSEILQYPRIPGCAHCRQRFFLPSFPLGKKNSEDVRLTDSAIVFEDYIGVESKRTVGASVRRSFVPDRTSTAQPSKRFVNCKHIPLPSLSANLKADALPLIRRKRSRIFGSVTQDNVATLLALTGGIRSLSERAVRRWAANAGNLGSIELFLIARDVEGVREGTYFYQAAEHALVSLEKRESLTATELIRRTLRCRGRLLPKTLIVLTGAQSRLSPKYGPFAYRLTNLDAGAAFGQLDLAARGLSLYARMLPEWPDDLLEEELSLQTPEQQVTAVVEINSGIGALWRSLPRAMASFSTQRHYPSWKAVPSFRGLSAQKVMEDLYRESRIPEELLGCGPALIPAEVLPKTPADRRSTIKLPPIANKGLSVAAILAGRRSVREFSSAALPAACIHTALQAAHERDSAEWPDENRVGVCLNFLVLARNVDGVDGGVYKYHPEHRCLDQIRSSCERRDLLELFVQDEYADAPAVIWITGNLAAACARRGAFGHRQLLLRAGAAAHRLWMTTLALGFQGSMFAGLIPGAARRTLGIDGFTSASLLACAAGLSVSGKSREETQDEGF